MTSTPDQQPALAPAGSRVLVVDADRDTQELVEQWLAAECCSVAVEGSAGATGGFDVAIVDVPYPRQSVERLRALRAAHPDTPLLVMSATLFSSAECSGPCAKALGVAGVLPKPTTREALVAAVHRLANGRADGGR